MEEETLAPWRSNGWWVLWLFDWKVNLWFDRMDLMRFDEMCFSQFDFYVKPTYHISDIWLLKKLFGLPFFHNKRNHNPLITVSGCFIENPQKFQGHHEILPMIMEQSSLASHHIKALCFGSPRHKGRQHIAQLTPGVKSGRAISVLTTIIKEISAKKISGNNEWIIYQTNQGPLKSGNMMQHDYGNLCLELVS